MTKKDQILIDCWNNSLEALGTSYVFQLKAAKYEKRIRYITLLGLIVPLLLGTIVSTYGQDSIILKICLFITAPLAILQAFLSGISLSYKWDDNLKFSMDSQSDNRVLSDAFENLAKFPPATEDKLEQDYNILNTKYEARERLDEKIIFSAKENRIGMRYALWIKQKECATCHIIPSSMEPTNCNTCGNF